MPPQPHPQPTLMERAAASTTYITGSAEITVTAVVGSDDTALPLDTNSAGSGGSATANPASVSFEGVGGTLTADTLTQTTTSTTSATASPTSSVASSGGTAKNIPVGAVVTAFCVVAVLCILLIVFFWWRRRKSRREAAEEREKRRFMSERNKSFVGGHGLTGEEEGNWEEFKTIDSGLHVPGNLPSPSTTGKSLYSDNTPETRLLSKISTSAVALPPRRLSVKSTLTGKVNPSNNFADESVEDYYDDAKSARSRYHHGQQPSSPGLMNATFRTLASQPKMQAVTSGGREAAGNSAPFLSFRSEEVAELHQPFSFPPQPQPTPAPIRALTQKSHHGGGASQHGHGSDEKQRKPKRKNTKDANASVGSAGSNNMIALTNLIAALDTPDEDAARRSVGSHLTRDDRISTFEPHAIASPSDVASRNPDPFDSTAATQR